MLGEPGLDGRGGTAIVLLHGWAAPGDEMLGLAGRLARPGVRFFAPVGPQPPAGAPRGRAWWNVYGADIPKMPWDGVMPASYRPNTQMTAARAAVHAVLKTIRTRIVPDELFIAGFSQGAMLALDVALTAEQPLDRAAGLSAVLVPESLEALRAPRPPRTPQTAFFLSHGRRDAILGFNGGERARKLLEQHGYPVTFEAFDGGHEIPKSVVSALGRFFFD
jgi:phospholipase/carboxylesterase